MGQCRFCGERAGWFRSQHAECARKNADARAVVRDAIYSTLEGARADLAFRVEGLSTAEAAGEAASIMRSFLAARFSERRPLGHVQAAMISELCSRFNFEPPLTAELVRGARLLVAAGVAVNGTPPAEVDAPADADRIFFFSADERPIYFCRNILYAKEGAIRGSGQIYQKRVDAGILAVTDRNLHFFGSMVSVKVPLAKVSSLHLWFNGVGVYSSKTKQEFFLAPTGEAWAVESLIRLAIAINRALPPEHRKTSAQTSRC